MDMLAVYTCPVKDGDVVHVGDYALNPRDPNRGIPEELFLSDVRFPVIIEYDSATGRAEWWPPMAMGPGPTEAPWSHPTAALTLPRMEMYALLDAALAEYY